MEHLKEFIRPELVVIIPVIYIIGMALKKSERISDKHIPFVLGICGVALSTLYVGSTASLNGVHDVLGAIFMSLTQGVLCAGASVYVNQLIKQEREDK